MALVVMADGVGGLPLGGEAAEAATNHAFRRLRRELPKAIEVGVEGVRTLLLSAAWSAAGAVAAAARDREIRRYEGGLCTTLLLAVALADAYVLVWIGDGGAHVLRGDGTVEPLLDPHKSPDAPTLLEAWIGPETDGVPSWKVKRRRSGDVFLVATDGVADRFDAALAARFRTAIERSGSHAKRALQDLLGELAGERSDCGRYTFTDNLTAALVLTEGTLAADPTDALSRKPATATGGGVARAAGRQRMAARANGRHEQK